MRITILSLLLAAIAFPGTAAAQKLDVEGPLTIKGHGPLRGELKAANPSETRAVVVGGHVGFVRFVDLAGDLRVQCKGRGDAAARENEEGQKVYTCKGRGGRARVHGSHFRVVLFAMQYGIRIPEGVTGTLQGRFRRQDEQAGNGGERGKERGEQPKDKPAPPTDEEIEEAIDEASGGE